ncbi:LysR family transcriptional regulator [Verticiella sediminum]|uniref:LysR family transcriptional regulator n=1 Tax=Verticiella sediminum TaxID=1247510 RepID=A0A556AVY8_9BURK|nr:LysR family transcriptional regulator [Verticiella sediminum]TSH97118.1 LysR family transcriptional regulator [Verticiella sediminum]
METDFLKTLLRVAETGSMAQAARSLDMTPGAVAHHVHALEDMLGVALVARSGRTVMPTPAGYRLLERARPLLADVVQLRACVHESSFEGELRIGAINTVLHTVFPQIMDTFVAAYPRVRLHVHSGVSHQLFDLIQQDALDVAVCLHPQFALAKTFTWTALREEPLVVLAPGRWARRDPMALLREEAFVRYDRSLGGGKQADAYLRRHDILPHERVELTSLLAIAMMVDRGLGVSLVPDVQSPLTAHLRLARLALPDAPEPRSFGVLCKRGSFRASLAQAFRDVASEVAAVPAT